MAERTGREGEWETSHRWRYDPLHDDAQAMALVKRFRLNVTVSGDTYWDVDNDDGSGRRFADAMQHDLNRAIVECVAKMQAARNDSVTQKE
jgi:predicted NAD/FAD-dependent oxidoreductase